jgi:hypothetical protein
MEKDATYFLLINKMKKDATYFLLKNKMKKGCYILFINK